MVRQGQSLTRAEGSMAKLVAGGAVKVTEQAIQILGGNGYTREYPVERWHRDAKIFTIFEGANRSSAWSSPGISRKGGVDLAELRSARDRGRPPRRTRHRGPAENDAHCIDGQAAAATQRITDCPRRPRGRSGPGDEGPGSKPAA
jgi:hypothetical protein